MLPPLRGNILHCFENSGAEASPLNRQSAPSHTPIYAKAERSAFSSGPRPAQHDASFPSTTTAGTLRTP